MAAITLHYAAINCNTTGRYLLSESRTRKKYLPALLSVIPWWVSSRVAVIGTERHEAGNCALADAPSPSTLTTQPDNGNLYSFARSMDMGSVCTCALGSLPFFHHLILPGISTPGCCQCLASSQPFPTGG